MKNLRKEISQLKLSLQESRLEEARLKKITEEQAQTIEENKMNIDKLNNRERLLSQNVEELVKVIREAESEASRWREACELEVEAGQREVEERNELTSIPKNRQLLIIQIAVLKAEVEKMRSALSISEGKLKLKEELAKAAMTAEAAAERSLRLSERRIVELLSRIEHQYHQLEEAESSERKRRKVRYLWCWPLWRFPAAATASAVTGTESSSCYRQNFRNCSDIIYEELAVVETDDTSEVIDMVVIVVVEASYLVSGRVMDVVIEEVIVIEEVVVDMKEAMISISDIAKNIDLYRERVFARCFGSQNTSLRTKTTTMEEAKKQENVTVKKIVSSCDVEALKKCLEENKGDQSKCQSEVEAFRSSCALPQPKTKP
ncbi:hypothetical protein YC2023_101674 [Brassica napus]